MLCITEIQQCITYIRFLYLCVYTCTSHTFFYFNSKWHIYAGGSKAQSQNKTEEYFRGEIFPCNIIQGVK